MNSRYVTIFVVVDVAFMKPCLLGFSLFLSKITRDRVEQIQKFWKSVYLSN